MTALHAVNLPDLSESLGLDSDIEFVKDVLNRHDLTSTEREDQLGKLEAIEKRMADPSLHLAVVGEFSSGKSTLINALMRDEILTTDILPATTSAATEIRFGESLRASITFLDGSQRHLVGVYSTGYGTCANSTESETETIRELIQESTSIETTASGIRKVTVSYPSDALRQGLVIIDTPGVNAGNARHLDVTSWAIRELSDIAVVLIPADIPASESLLNFVVEHLSDSLHRCLFVVSKIDLIKANEQDRCFAGLEARLSHRLGLDGLSILPIAAELVLDSIRGEEGSDNGYIDPERRQQLLDQFYNSEKRLWESLHRHKIVTIMERLAFLMLAVFRSLGEQLKRRETMYNERREMFEKNRVPDLGSFVDVQKTKRHLKIEARGNELRGELLDMIDKVHQKARRVLDELVNSAKSSEWLAQELSKKNLKAILREIELRIQDELAQCFDDFEYFNVGQTRRFAKKFSKTYSSLASLGNALGIDTPVEIKPVSLDLAGKIRKFDAQLAEVSDRISASLRLDFQNMFATSPSVNEIKKEYRSLLATIMDQVFSEVSDSIRTRFAQNIEAMKKAMDKYIDDHFSQYDQLILEIVKSQEQEIGAINSLRDTVTQDRNQLSERRDRLVRNREKLKSVQVH